MSHNLPLLSFLSKKGLTNILDKLLPKYIWSSVDDGLWGPEMHQAEPSLGKDLLPTFRDKGDLSGYASVTDICLAQSHALSWGAAHIQGLRQGSKVSAISAQHRTALMGNTHWLGLCQAGTTAQHLPLPILLLPLPFARCWSPINI